MGCGVPLGDPLRHPPAASRRGQQQLVRMPLGESGLKRLTWRQRFPKTPATHAIGRTLEDFRIFARQIPLRCTFLRVGRRDPPLCAVITPRKCLKFAETYSFFLLRPGGNTYSHCFPKERCISLFTRHVVQRQKMCIGGAFSKRSERCDFRESACKTSSSDGDNGKWTPRVLAHQFIESIPPTAATASHP